LVYIICLPDQMSRIHKRDEFINIIETHSTCALFWMPNGLKRNENILGIFLMDISSFDLYSQKVFFVYLCTGQKMLKRVLECLRISMMWLSWFCYNEVEYEWNNIGWRMRRQSENANLSISWKELLNYFHYWHVLKKWSDPPPIMSIWVSFLWPFCLNKFILLIFKRNFYYFLCLLTKEIQIKILSKNIENNNERK